MTVRRVTILYVVVWVLLGIAVAALAGCIDHDWQIVRHRIENCTEETFLVPIDDLKQRLEAADGKRRRRDMTSDCILNCAKEHPGLGSDYDVCIGACEEVCDERE